MNQNKNNKVIDLKILIYLFLVIIAFVSGGFSNVTKDDISIYNFQISSAIECCTITFLGIVTLIDLFYTFGFDVFVPRSIKLSKENFERKKIEQTLDAYYGENLSKYSKMLDTIFDNDRRYIELNQENNINYILNQLGISAKQFEDIQRQMIRLSLMPQKDGDINDAKQKIDKLLRDVPQIIYKQSFETANRAYPNVQYYIDLITIMRDTFSRESISFSFSEYIKASLKENLLQVNRIAIPKDSNFQLGIQIGKNLGIPQIIIRDKGRIKIDNPWDGDLQKNDTVLIVTDVLVTGMQIYDCIEKIKHFSANINIIGVACIIRRTEYEAMEQLKNKYQCIVYSIMDVDDKGIEENYGKNIQILG